MTLTVMPAKTIGKGCEFIMRYVATGSFVRRFGDYCTDGQILAKPIYEITLKDDKRDDPPVTGKILRALGLATKEEKTEMKKLTKEICAIVKEDLAKRGVDLWDIKIELGKVDGKIVLIDEISAGNMRGYKAGKKLSYDELSELF